MTTEQFPKRRESDAQAAARIEKLNTRKPNYKLTCGHMIWWHGEDADPKFAPPSTLWCRECRARVRTS